MKRQGMAINKQLTGSVTVLEPDDLRSVVEHRSVPCNLQINLQQLMLGLLTLGLVACAPAKPPATSSPTVEATPIVSPTPSITPSASPTTKPSTSSSRDGSVPDAPAESRRVEPERDSSGSVEETPVQKSKAIEATGEKPPQSEKPAPSIEPEAPARVPQPSEIAPTPPAPKAPIAPKAPAQSDDPEPPPAL